MRLQILDSLAILLHDIDGLLTSAGKELAHSPTVGLNLPGLDGDVGGLSPGHRLGLVEEDGGVGKSRSATPLALCKKHSCGAESLAKGNGVDRRSNVLHNIGNGKGLGLEANGLTGGCRGPRRVDVHSDGIRCRLIVQIEKLSNNKLSNGRDQRHTNVNDAIVEKERRKIRRRADADTCGKIDEEKGFFSSVSDKRIYIDMCEKGRNQKGRVDFLNLDAKGGYMYTQHLTLLIASSASWMPAFLNFRYHSD